MVGPVTSKPPVSSHTQISLGAAAMSESSRSRTGSPSALNIGASVPAWSVVSGARTSGAQQAAARTAGCFDMPLA